MMRSWGSIVLAGLLATSFGCESRRPVHSTDDVRRCNPECSSAEACIEGKCVGFDAGVLPDTVAPDHDTIPLDAGVLPDAVAPKVPGTWITVPAGTFMMGSPTSEPCRDVLETQHQVTLTHAFEIQSTEVTQGQFEILMGYNPANFTACGKDCPVQRVNWYEAAAYCNALSKNKGLAECYACKGGGAAVTCAESPAYTGQSIYDCPGYRLPTEAEWEYAYRAGTTTSSYVGQIAVCYGNNDPIADKIAWYKENSSDTVHSVGSKQKNAWGLYDMAGNVWEWCNDVYWGVGSSAVTDPFGPPAGTRRVQRGGSYRNEASHVRAAARPTSPYPWRRYVNLGFRCVRTVGN